MGDAQFLDAGLDNVATCVPWLLEHMAKQGVTIHPQSTFAEYAKLAIDFGKRAPERPLLNYKGLNGAHRAQQEYLRVTGMDYLSKALHRGRVHGLGVEHRGFKRLCSGNPVLTEPSGNSTTERNSTWELLLGSLMAPFSTDVRFVEPPDITCKHGGKRVGVSAKVFYSHREDEFLKDVKKGARQLEQANVDYGFVAINLVEVFPHAAMMDHFVRTNPTDLDAFTNSMDGWARSFMARHDLDKLAHSLKGTTKLAAIILFVPTALHFAAQPCPYYRVHFAARDGFDDIAKPFLWALNESSQTVLAWRPGTKRTSELSENTP